MKRKILNKNWKIKKWLILGHFFLLLIIILFVSQNCARQGDQKTAVLLPEPTEDLELPDDFDDLNDEEVEDWLEGQGASNKAPFVFEESGGEGNIVFRLRKIDGRHYGGTVIVYGGEEKGGGFYSKKNNVSKNYWIENDSDGLIWTGVFQTSSKGNSEKVGGAIVIITDRLFNEGEGYSHLISGTVWLKELPSRSTTAPFPPRPCWTFDLGPFPCQFDLRFDRGEGIYYPQAKQTTHYRKWGTFKQLDRVEAGLGLNRPPERNIGSVKEGKKRGIKIIRNLKLYLKSFFNWLKSLVKGR